MKVITEYLEISDEVNRFYDTFLLEQLNITEHQLLEFQLKIPKFSKFIRATKNTFSKAQPKLKKVGIELKDIKYQVNQSKRKIVKELNTVNKKNIKNVSKKVTKIIVNDIEELTQKQKIIKSIAILIILVYVQLITIAIAGLIITPIFGTIGTIIFAACIVAPLTEEYAKRLAIKENYPWLYTTVFSLLEFARYFMIFTSGGLSIPVVAGARIAVVGMHFFTTWIQKKFHDTKNKNVSKFGYIVAVLIHAAWNAMAILN